MTFSATGAARTEVGVRRLYFARQTILGTTMGSPRDFADPLERVAQMPDWRPLVDRVLPLEDAAQAHRHMEAGCHTGKIVLHVSG